jgi:hypothetical protein
MRPRARVDHARADERDERALVGAAHHAAGLRERDEAEMPGQSRAGRLPHVAQVVSRGGRPASRRVEDVLPPVVVHRVDGEVGRVDA